MTDTQHEYKRDVDSFMERIHIAINLRLESDKKASIHNPMRDEWVGAHLRQESDEMLKKAEYMLYELIDNALDDGVFHAESQGALE